mmetsp:Transcript_2966/g.6331  ORF Transcript_2966/g.6331 Transcript_2966/m.6331 type:complete len:98 (+) Transcript_2966:664-957(+)
MAWGKAVANAEARILQRRGEFIFFAFFEELVLIACLASKALLTPPTACLANGQRCGAAEMCFEDIASAVHFVGGNCERHDCKNGLLYILDSCLWKGQ